MIVFLCGKWNENSLTYAARSLRDPTAMDSLNIHKKGFPFRCSRKKKCILYLVSRSSSCDVLCSNNIDDHSHASRSLCIYSPDYHDDDNEIINSFFCCFAAGFEFDVDLAINRHARECVDDDGKNNKNSWLCDCVELHFQSHQKPYVSLHSSSITGINAENIIIISSSGGGD